MSPLPDDYATVERAIPHRETILRLTLEMYVKRYGQDTPLDLGRLNSLLATTNQPLANQAEIRRFLRPHGAGSPAQLNRTQIRGRLPSSRPGCSFINSSNVGCRASTGALGMGGSFKMLRSRFSPYHAAIAAASTRSS